MVEFSFGKDEKIDNKIFNILNKIDMFYTQ